ncbi:MAG: polysaccharide lyase family 8 super-sandwich domain-containing protein [Thermoguttaceae bacterium]
MTSLERRGVLLCIGLLVAVAASARADDFLTVEEHIIARIQASPAKASTVSGYLASLGANGSWTDVNYADRSWATWSPTTHMSRLREMAKAYADPANSLHGNAALKDGILKAYDYWIAVDPHSDNWWHNEIATPQTLSETMLLVQGELSTARFSSGLNVVARAYLPRSQNSGTNTGANRVDRAYASLNRGVLSKTASLVSESFGAVADTILVTPAEGIQPDYSFHQHGPQLQNASYGMVFTNGVSKFAAFGAGTSFALSQDKQKVLADYFLDGDQWFIRGVSFEFTTMGRGISRSGTDRAGVNMIGPIKDVLALGDYRAGELTAMKTRLEAAQSSGVADPARALVGNRHFWRSDIMTHHRPEYYASVKTSSTRTYQPESGNGEGLQNLHLADGVNMVMRTGDEYDGIFPVWDWRRLPGTTTEQRSYSLKPSRDWGVYGTSTFAGGVSDGTCGATAIDYARLNVAAKKAWFFFDNEYVALGAGIDGPNAASNVITTLNQTLANGTVTYATTGGGLQTLASGAVTRGDLAWVHHDGIGYLFLSPTDSVTLQSVSQSGSWYAINQSQSSATVTRDVFSLQVNHGARPSGATYAYVVAPGAAANEMGAYAADVPLTVLQNTPSLQAVRHNRLGLTQAAFYTPGSLQIDSQLSVDVHAPVLFMLQELPEGLRLSAANPRNEAMTLRAEIRRTFAGEGEEFSRITMRLPDGALAGQSVVRTLDNPVLPTDVAQFRQSVAGTSGLIHHYTFEGQSLAQRLEDKVASGAVNLQQMAYGSAGNVDEIVYAFGLDHSTLALSPQRLSAAASGEGGAALASVAALALPRTLSVEALIRPENVETGGQAGYAVMAGGWTNSQRAYFVAQVEKQPNDALATIIGDSLTESDNRRELPGSLTPGHWYYVVNTYQSDGANTIINSYLADVTAGETTLRQLLTDALASGSIPLDSPLGIGGLFHAGAFQEAWSGSLDEIAFYDRVLASSELQLHLDALYSQAVPEPSAVVLLAVGMLLLWLGRRSRFPGEKQRP